MTKGIKNYQWKGGVAEYPNHYLMKQHRLLKLQQTKAQCEICKEKANLIHHKDGSKDNHDLENLIVLCDNCHNMIDQKNAPCKSSKFIRLYGMTLAEMSKKLGGSETMYWKLHRKNHLKSFLQQKSSWQNRGLNEY